MLFFTDASFKQCLCPKCLCLVSFPSTSITGQPANDPMGCDAITSCSPKLTLKVKKGCGLLLQCKNQNEPNPLENQAYGHKIQVEFKEGIVCTQTCIYTQWKSNHYLFRNSLILALDFVNLTLFHCGKVFTFKFFPTIFRVLSNFPKEVSGQGSFTLRECLK